MELLDYLKKIGREFTQLPDNLSVGGYLDLEDTAIAALPDNLSVGGSLDLRGTAIAALPDGLQVGRSLYLQGAVGGTVSRKGCGDSGRTIFAAKVNGGIRIVAGCFLGTLDKFEEAVDRKYSGAAAQTYKSQARECVEELQFNNEELK